MKRIFIGALVLVSGCADGVKPGKCYTCTDDIRFVLNNSQQSTRRTFEVCGDAELARYQGKTRQEAYPVGGQTVNATIFTQCVAK